MTSTNKTEIFSLPVPNVGQPSETLDLTFPSQSLFVVVVVFLPGKQAHLKNSIRVSTA